MSQPEKPSSQLHEGEAEYRISVEARLSALETESRHWATREWVLRWGTGFVLTVAGVVVAIVVAYDRLQ